MHCYYTRDPDQEEEFQAQLRDAVDQCHSVVLSEAQAGRAGMATTLTLVMVMWPRAFVAQVGDSRAYLLRKGALVRLTRDQTVAQELYDDGMISTSTMKLSPMRNVLTSAIGGSSIKSATTLVDLELGDVLMLCSDGLSDLVSDDQITSRLSQFPNPEDACRALVDDALAAGGRDNITVVVGRSTPLG
jgi:protein phosphatase